jgi:hypothetical protein
MLLVLAIATAPAVAQSGPGQRSTDLAAELDGLLAQRGLDAFAIADPEMPDRFVAALAFPKSQLLVVEARYPAPALMLRDIAAKKYRDAYMALQQAGLPEGKLFYLDIGFDGLRGRSDAVDVLYEGANEMVFDGAPGKHKLTEAAYERQFGAAETTYTRLLTELIAQLKDSSSQ